MYMYSCSAFSLPVKVTFFFLHNGRAKLATDLKNNGVNENSTTCIQSGSLQNYFSNLCVMYNYK